MISFRPADDISSLLASVRADGWDAAYYRHCCQRVGAGEFIDDDRLADWRFLTPISARSDTLVVGCGFGTTACCLSETSRAVRVVEPDVRRLQLLEHRCMARGFSNVHGVHVKDPRSLPFKSSSFDLIAFRINDWPMSFSIFSAVLYEFRRVLKDCGAASLVVANSWSPLRFVAPGRNQGGCTASLRSYIRMLHRGGFAPPRVYAVLPSSEVSPLFWVPIDEGGAFEYFFESLVGLFDLASPEARSRYAWASRLARLGVRVARRVGVVRRASYFVPSFGLITGPRSRGNGLC